MSKEVTTTQQTMLSTEIAALTGKRHDHVMRDIRVIIEQLEDYPDLGSGFKSSTYLSGNGKQEKCYELDYDATMIVLTGYDVVARTKVIKRWQELEQQAAKLIDPMALFSDPTAMLQLATDYAKRLIEKDEVIAQQAPKVEAFEKLIDVDGGLNITSAAKNMQIPPKKLFDFLSSKKWIYRRIGGKGWVAYQEKIQAGYLTHKVSTIQLQDGSEKLSESVVVTTKGLTKLASIYA